MNFNQDIHIGQLVRLDFSQVNYTEFEELRNEFRRSLGRGLFTTYQVDTLKTHFHKARVNQYGKFVMIFMKSRFGLLQNIIVRKIYPS